MKKKIAVILGDPSLPDKVKLNRKFNQGDIEVIDILKRALNLINGYEFRYYNNHERLIEDLVIDSENIHLALNLCDEGFFNDPNQEAVIPVILEDIVKIPYSGASLGCLVRCYKKSDVKSIAMAQGIPTSQFKIIRRSDKIELPRIDFPAFVKPDKGDGSWGINNNSIVSNKDGFYSQVVWLRKELRSLGNHSDVLVEKYLSGKELTAAIIGNHPMPETRLSEEVPSEGSLNFQVYAEKWDPKHPQYYGSESIRPTIPKKAQDLIEEYSKYLFNLLECRDYARFDWRLDGEGNPNLMEANPNCGWCWDGHLVKAFSKENGFDINMYTKILKKIIETAEKRYYR